MGKTLNARRCGGSFSGVSRFSVQIFIFNRRNSANGGEELLPGRRWKREVTDRGERSRVCYFVVVGGRKKTNLKGNRGEINKSLAKTKKAR